LVYPGGYRGFLYSNLESENINVQYVGVSNDNPSSALTAAGQTANNGFGGYTISEIAAGLNGPVTPHSGIASQGGYWLTGSGGTGRGPETADVILLLIGTNDFGQQYDPLFSTTSPMNGAVYPYQGASENNQVFAADAASRYESLIQELVTLEPNATILVGTTLPFYLDPRVAMLNSAVESYIQEDMGADKVHSVDLYSTFDDPNDPGLLNPLYDGGDGIHPNGAGYEEMASLWNQAIMQDVNMADYQVPEPSTYALLLGGTAGLLVFRRFRLIRRGA
jgi:lysophospholipase L1-like esterase